MLREMVIIGSDMRNFCNQSEGTKLYLYQSEPSALLSYNKTDRVHRDCLDTPDCVVTFSFMSINVFSKDQCMLTFNKCLFKRSVRVTFLSIANKINNASAQK